MFSTVDCPTYITTTASKQGSQPRFHGSGTGTKLEVKEISLCAGRALHDDTRQTFITWFYHYKKSLPGYSENSLTYSIQEELTKVIDGGVRPLGVDFG
jgi:hypothetical protein